MMVNACSIKCRPCSRNGDFPNAFANRDDGYDRRYDRGWHHGWYSHDRDRAVVIRRHHTWDYDD